MPRPWSRHDLAFAASALALLAIAIGVLAGAWGEFDAYPRLFGPLTPATLIAIAAFALCALLPFADRRGDRAMTASLRAVERCLYRYPGVDAAALDDVSLAVAPGELVLLAGGSGSGKSTLLRAAAGLVPVSWRGRVETTRPPNVPPRARARPPRAAASTSRPEPPASSTSSPGSTVSDTPSSAAAPPPGSDTRVDHSTGPSPLEGSSADPAAVGERRERAHEERGDRDQGRRGSGAARRG